MELKDRIRRILHEQHIKQKDLAGDIKVTESYVSNLLNGKRRSISEALALLIEQVYGYSAQWVLTGEGDCYAVNLAAANSTPAKKRLIAEIEELSAPEVAAVQVFVDSLDGYKKAFDLSE